MHKCMTLHTFYCTDIFMKLDLRTYKDFSDKIQGMSRTWALFKEFPGLELTTKQKLHYNFQ